MSNPDRSPEQEGFLKQIPRLTSTALTGSERQRIAAIAQLTAGISEDVAYDPVLFAIKEVQDSVRMDRGRTRIVRRAEEVISAVITAGVTPSEAHPSIVANIGDPTVMRCIKG